MKKGFIAGLLVLAASAAPALAQGKSSAAAAPMSDQAFVLSAAHANLAEIELGKLAETKASSEAVKDFAKRMVDDHQKALNNLEVVAKKENLTLPTTLEPKDQALKDRLDKLSGHAFDTAYMSAMVKDHHADVAEFQAKARDAKSPDVKEYASSTLPVLEDHLKLAQTTDKSIVGTSGKGTSTKPVK